MLMTCLAQLGPLLVLVPSIIWFTGRGIPRKPFCWSGAAVGTMDNVIRPILIRMGGTCR